MTSINFRDKVLAAGAQRQKTEEEVILKKKKFLNSSLKAENSGKEYRKTGYWHWNLQQEQKKKSCFGEWMKTKNGEIDKTTKDW